MLTGVYEDETLSPVNVFEWHKRFSGGRVSVKDDDEALKVSDYKPKYVENLLYEWVPTHSYDLICGLT
ncbi:hypothetical protein TNCV_906431 [Trichonephila clavipes]|nr:hypothetical protein TNCV_906431 [Trichonephila clavipes]